MNYGFVPTYGTVAEAPAEVRATFVRRVYGLFFVSVLVTILVSAFCAQQAIAATLMPMLLPLLIIQLVLGIIMAFARRTTGLNIALFYLFSATEGMIIGPLMTLVSRVAPGVPLEAAVLTGAVFAGLSLYALQSGKDFSFLGGMLFVGLIALVIGGLVMMFVHVAALYTLYCIIGVLIFSGYVLYDTSLIMRRLYPGEEIVGAISLYLDLINLFWLILQLLMELQRRD
jgi:FtsH-binding integral membrane protein